MASQVKRKMGLTRIKVGARSGIKERWRQQQPVWLSSQKIERPKWQYNKQGKFEDLKETRLAVAWVHCISHIIYYTTI